MWYVIVCSVAGFWFSFMLALNQPPNFYRESLKTIAIATVFGLSIKVGFEYGLWRGIALWFFSLVGPGTLGLIAGQKFRLWKAMAVIREYERRTMLMQNENNADSEQQSNDDRQQP